MKKRTMRILDGAFTAVGLTLMVLWYAVGNYWFLIGAAIDLFAGFPLSYLLWGRHRE